MDAELRRPRLYRFVDWLGKSPAEKPDRWWRRSDRWGIETRGYWVGFGLCFAFYAGSMILLAVLNGTG